MGQSALIVDFLALLHEDAEIVSFALLWLFGALQVLLRNVCPVAQAALHDALNQSDLLQRRPVTRQQREVQIVVDVVVVRREVHRVLRGRFPKSQAFQAHDKLALGHVGRHRAILGGCDWGDRAALSAQYLDALRDVALAQRADLWAKQVLWLLEPSDDGVTWLGAGLPARSCAIT